MGEVGTARWLAPGEKTPLDRLAALEARVLALETPRRGWLSRALLWLRQGPWR